MLVNLSRYLIIIPAVLIAIIVHEVAHGAMAYALGDSTAKNSGRLSLNPINHIDPIGLLCMIFFGFGWARPVPVNMSNIKNKKVGMPLVALAGPLANFLLAFVSFLIVITLQSFIGRDNSLLNSFASFMTTMASMSVGLGVFNLIPVPPLDGSNIIYPFLPNSIKKFMYEYGQYIQFALVVLLVLNVFDSFLIKARFTVLSWIVGLALHVVGFFAGIF